MVFREQLLHKILLAFLAIGLCFTTAYAQHPQRETRSPAQTSGALSQCIAVRRVEPAHPPLAKANRVSGPVVVEVTVDEEGNVMQTRAISGHPLLKDAALTAARAWKFKPTTLHGVPVKVIGTITFNFDLDGTKSDSKAAEELERKAAANPTSPDLHYKLGQAYLADSRYEKAIAALSRAIEIKPDFAEAYCELARACHSLGHDDEALVAVQRAVKIDPQTESAAYAFLLIGKISLRQGRFEEAIEAFKQTLIITSDSGEPESDDAHFGLGVAYVKVEDKRLALKEYEALRKREWISPEATKPLKQLIDAMP